MKVWNCHFLMILTFTFDVYFTVGLKWITEPLPVNKCKGQTANFTWVYSTEPDEEITQLQWIFNTTMLIAYSSMNQGFNVEPNYQGRVSQSGETGILLYNISSKDIGNYTLYPSMKWEESPNIQTVRLNVIEAAMEPVCNPNNVTERTTQSGNVTQEGDPAEKIELYVDLLNQKNTINWVLGISIVCMLVMFIIMGILLRVFCLIQMNSKKLKKSTIEASASEDNQERHSLRRVQEDC